jgi:hypothetical protein
VHNFTIPELAGTESLPKVLSHDLLKEFAGYGFTRQVKTNSKNDIRAAERSNFISKRIYARIESLS